MDPFLFNLLRLELTLGDIGDLIIPQVLGLDLTLGDIGYLISSQVLRPWVFGDEFLLIFRVWFVILVILIVFPNLTRGMIEPPTLSVPILIP